MKRTLSRLWALSSRLPAPLRRHLNALPGIPKARRLAMGRPGGRPPRPGGLRPVVYLPTWAQWDVMRQRPQYLLAAFARAGHEVFFVDPREETPRTADGVHLVPDLAPVPGFSPILYVHHAPLVDVLDLFADPVVVYDVLDDLSIYGPGESGLPAGRTVTHRHHEMMEAATLVIFSAGVLADRYDDGSGRSLLVPNGVEVERFATPRPRPRDLPDGGGTLIGYHGAIAPWLDFDLIEAIAARRPSDQIVLVGPVLEGAGDHAARLARIENVTLIGERSPDTIAGYVQAFDVGVIPFVVDNLTEGVSPLKMYEYLAAGVPVVATPLPACVEHPLVATAATVASFEDALTAAVALRSDHAFGAAASQAAAEASWDGRVGLVRGALEERGSLVVRPG